ncbi:hypothetical protein EDD86DRAFT_136644 [Gorgonomyces haynaldii]|nr:hypothetical protein EDD86DRAFT_136644 [Gorgonomyces haynaldii]
MQTGVQPVVQPQTGIASQNGASQGYPPQNGLQPAAVPSQPVQQQQGFQPVQPVQQQQGYQPIQQQQGFQPVQQQQGFQPVQQAVQGGFQPVQGVPQPQGYQPPATFNQQSGFQTPQPGLQQAQVVYQQPPTAAFGNMNIGGQLLAPNSVNLMAGPPQYENNRSVQPNINHVQSLI